MKKTPGNIRDIIKNLPENPGVYIMKDGAGNILYIGKASSLKKRVPSYFRNKETDVKTKILSGKIRYIEYIITDSEIEALILESTLIKKHRPRYNINLKDDKRYPYIAVTLSEDYPRVILTRRLLKNGDRYFGPYTDSKAARSTVSIVNSIFKLKECGKTLPLKNKTRPCLNFDIKKCAGVCRGVISINEYNSIVDRAIQFLEGDIKPVTDSLNSLMADYSKNREYEKAARVRDILFDIQKISEKQKVYTPIGMDQDFIGVNCSGDEAVIVLFEFRSGVLLSRKISVYNNIEFSTTGEILKSFIIDYYDEVKIPARIITDNPVADKNLIIEHLRARGITKLKISTAISKIEKNIMSMLKKNIDIIAADRSSNKRHRQKEEGLRELKDMLNLKRPPEIIECFDISNIQGKHSVASMVRFKDGLPEKSGYRRYRIKAYDSANDPGMIHEAVGRRMQYLINEGLPLPDLVVVDGGKAQLRRALEIREALELDLEIISIAKRLEEIYAESAEGPIRLNNDSPALKIIQNIRDEAHRFAITYHKKLRDKGTVKSAIDDIPDIGEKRKSLLLKHFKSVEKIKNAAITELQSVPGIGKKNAEAIYAFFHGS